MGWASAGDIFDPVAQGLIDAGATDDIKRQVLGTLIDKLQDGDWDTENESVDAFRNDPIIVAEFVKRGVRSEIDGEYVNGVFIVDDEAEGGESWTLACEGRSGCGEVATRPLTTAGYDELVRAWAAHEQERHGGDGGVADWMLLGEAA